MNKLEQLIEEKVKTVFRTDIGENPFSGSFVAGTDFVIRLDLPVKFAEWKQDNVRGYIAGELDGKYMVEYKPKMTMVFGGIKEVFEFWLNNVYDGK